MSATLDTTDRFGKTASILFVETDSSAPDLALIQLRLLADSVGAVQTAPQILDLGFMAEGSSASGKVRVVGSEKAELMAVSSGSDILTVHLEDAAGNNNVFMYLVCTLSDKCPVGDFRTRVTAEFKCQDGTVVKRSFSVRAKILPQIRPEPPSVFLGTVPADGPRDGAQVRLTIVSQSPDAAVSVADKPMYMTLVETVRAYRPERAVHDFIFAVDPKGLQPGLIQGAVVIASDRAGYERIEVPVIGMISGGDNQSDSVASQ